MAKSNTQIARDIMQEHGIKGFFTGLVPRILKVRILEVRILEVRILEVRILEVRGTVSV